MYSYIYILIYKYIYMHIHIHVHIHILSKLRLLLNWCSQSCYPTSILGCKPFKFVWIYLVINLYAYSNFSKCCKLFRLYWVTVWSAVKFLHLEENFKFYMEGWGGLNGRVPFTTSAEYNYQNTLRFFHFHANIQFPKRMERQLLRLTLQTRFWKAFW